MKIDLHTHILPHNWPDLDAKYGYSGFVRLVKHPQIHADSEKGGTVATVSRVKPSTWRISILSGKIWVDLRNRRTTSHPL